MRLLLPHFDSARSMVVRLIEPGGGDRPAAVFAPLNPLNGAVTRYEDRTLPLIIWSGTPASDLNEPDPRTWTGESLNEFQRWCEACAADDDRPSSVSFRLHARHVLSDVPGARRFLRDRRPPFGVTLSPATMLEPSMLDTLPEHLERMFEGLGDRADFIWIGDVKLDASGEWFTPAPPGEGLMPPAVLRSLLAEHVPASTPVIIDAPDEAAARTWLAI